jgi:hypothetical protein
MTKCEPVTLHNLLRIRRMRPLFAAAQSKSRWRLYKRAPPLPPLTELEEESSSSRLTAQSARKKTMTASPSRLVLVEYT